MRRIDYNEAYDVLGIVQCRSLSGGRQYLMLSMTSPNGFNSVVRGHCFNLVDEQYYAMA
jgi:hypothetical protein